MALNIKNPRTHKAIKELAERTGTSQANAVDIAVHAQLDLVRRAPHDPRYDALWDMLQAIAPRAREALGRADHGDTLYDENGLPR